MPLKHDVHAVVNALNAKGNGLGQYRAFCPLCQSTPASRADGGRHLQISQGRKVPLVLHCFAGCLFEDLVVMIGMIMSDYSSVGDHRVIETAQPLNDSEIMKRKRDVVLCIMENAEPAYNDIPTIKYAERLGLSEVPPTWYYTTQILGHEGLRIPEPNRRSIVVPSRYDGHFIGGQRILIDKNGERAKNNAGAKLNKFTFGLIRGHPYRTYMRNEPMTKALFVTESAETAGVLHAATGAECWAVFGVSNFKSIPLVDPPITRKRPVIFFPDMDAIGSVANQAMQTAIDHHSKNGYHVFTIFPPEPEGSKNNFADTCARLGLPAVKNYIKGEIDEIKRGINR